jgi:hypothetical protein
MSGFVAYAFSDQELADIRRFCGYPAVGDGNVVFPFPWMMREYLALEYRLRHLSQTDGATLLAQYLAPLYAIEQSLATVWQNLDTAAAAAWTHNAREQRDKEAAFGYWRRRLCAFLQIPPGPELSAGGGGAMRMVV